MVNEVNTHSGEINSNNEIWIVLSDDWELRGNGQGRVLEKQSIPAAKLMDLYDSLGIKSTFNVEVMQQLAFERHSSSSLEITEGRDEWRKSVVEMNRRGFDVQLHIHPQWWGAQLIDGWWKLNPKWHIVDYSKDEIECMVGESISYLRDLLPNKTIKAFRGGAWGMGPPSKGVHAALVSHGIRLDMSIVSGLQYRGNNISLDYRSVDSPYTPFFSNYADVRRKSKGPEESSGLLEIPTQSVTHLEFLSRILCRGLQGNKVLLREFYSYFKMYLVENVFASLLQPFRAKRNPESDMAFVPSFVHTDPFGFKSRRSKPPSPIIDLSSRYSVEVWKVLVDIVIGRAMSIKSNGVKVLIFENHTKDLESDGDFCRIKEVLEYIKHNYRDVHFKMVSDVVPLAEETVSMWFAGQSCDFPLCVSQ